MADVRPFRGLRYNTDVAGNLADLLSPPFDTIPVGLQQGLYQRSPYNVVRLESGLQFDSDTATANRYTRARDLFHQWQTARVLVRDPEPRFYLIHHSFTHQGQSYRRRGLVCRVHLEEYQRRVVLPHELTGERDKEDRLSLMRACQANISPIMCLYRDADGRVGQILDSVASSEPIYMGVRVDAQDYTLWGFSGADQVQAVQDAMASFPLYIADGHHRYETALRYRDLQPATPESAQYAPAHDFVLMTLIDFQDPGLKVLPYHRVLGPLSSESSTRVWQALEEQGQVTPADSDTLDGFLAEVESHGRDRTAMGVLGPRGKGPFILRLSQSSDAHPAGPIGESEPWLLEEQILRPLLADSLEQLLRYVHDAEEAQTLGLSEDGHIAFFQKPFPLGLFEKIVDSGQVLPRKSTFFYPKLPTGMVINSLEGPL